MSLALGVIVGLLAVAVWLLARILLFNPGSVTEETHDE